LEQLVLFVFKVEGRKSKSTLGGVSGKFLKVLSVRVAVSGKTILLKSFSEALLYLVGGCIVPFFSPISLLLV
jgi:hypothetical protein